MAKLDFKTVFLENGICRKSIFLDETHSAIAITSHCNIPAEPIDSNKYVYT